MGEGDDAVEKLWLLCWQSFGNGCQWGWAVRLRSVNDSKNSFDCSSERS